MSARSKALRPPCAPSSDVQRRRWIAAVARFAAGMPPPDSVGYVMNALRAAYQLGKGDAAAAPSGEAVRHAAAEVARRGAVAAYEEMAASARDGEQKHTRADAMEAIGRALDECEATIRALPLPAPDAVETARREFCEAARASMDANCNGDAFCGGPNEAAGLAAAAKCLDAYRALLAAEAVVALVPKGGAR